jgi:L-fuconolactonase
MHRAHGKEALRRGTYGTARICAGIVGHANLRMGARSPKCSRRHIHAGGGRFRGIRRIAAWA